MPSSATTPITDAPQPLAGQVVTSGSGGTLELQAQSAMEQDCGTLERTGEAAMAATAEKKEDEEEENEKSDKARRVGDDVQLMVDRRKDEGSPGSSSGGGRRRVKTTMC